MLSGEFSSLASSIPLFPEASSLNSAQIESFTLDEIKWRRLSIQKNRHKNIQHSKSLSADGAREPQTSILHCNRVNMFTQRLFILKLELFAFFRQSSEYIKTSGRVLRSIFAF